MYVCATWYADHLSPSCRIESFANRIAVNHVLLRWGPIVADAGADVASGWRFDVSGAAVTMKLLLRQSISIYTVYYRPLYLSLSIYIYRHCGVCSGLFYSVANAGLPSLSF